MTIKFNESLRGIWFCSSIPGEQDFLLSLNRITEEQYEVTYRFRYYNSADPFDEKDKKNWYSAKITGKSEKEIIDSIRTLLGYLLAKDDDIYPAEILRGDRTLDEFMDEFMKQDFVHAQKVH